MCYVIPAYIYLYEAQETKKCNSEILIWQCVILKKQFLELFFISLLCFSGSKLANSNFRPYNFIYHVKIDMHLKTTLSSTIFEKILIYISILSYKIQILFDWCCIEQDDFSHGLYQLSSHLSNFVNRFICCTWIKFSADSHENKVFFKPR